MTISPLTSQLPALKGDDPIPDWVISYLQVRYRNRLHSILLEELEKSGLTQAQVAKRAKMGKDQLSRLLSFPSNIEPNTYARILYAIAGAEATVSVEIPVKIDAEIYAPAQDRINVKSGNAEVIPGRNFATFFIEESTWQRQQTIKAVTASKQLSAEISRGPGPGLMPISIPTLSRAIWRHTT